MHYVSIFCPDDSASFDLGCLHEVLSMECVIRAGVKSGLYRLSAAERVDLSNMLVRMGACDTIVFCGIGRNINFANCSVAYLHSFVNRGGNVVVIGAVAHNAFRRTFLEGMNENIPKNIQFVASGFNILQWVTKFLEEKTGLKMAMQVAEHLDLCPHKLSLMLKEDTLCPPLSSSRLREVILWARDNIHAVQSVDQLADKACLSRRSFDRNFKQAVGKTPKEWLTDVRIQIAKTYLENSDLDLDEIASRSGFGNYPNLRNNFFKNLGQSPSNYRSVYKGALV